MKASTRSGDDQLFYTLADGRAVACIDPAETAMTWFEIQDEGTYEAAVSGFTGGELIVDVGAHIGLSAIYFADSVPDVRLLCFEPAPQTFACLSWNLARHVPESRAFDVAVGARPETRELQYFPNATTMSTLYPSPEDMRHNVGSLIANTGIGEDRATAVWRRLHTKIGMTVRVTTLTEIIERHGIEEIDLVKIDVERAELAVIRGVTGSCWPRIRRIVAEVHDIDGRLATVAAELESVGFRLRVHQEPRFAGGSVHIVLADRGPKAGR